jgi:hypothetical protein
MPGGRIFLDSFNARSAGDKTKQTNLASSIFQIFSASSKAQTSSEEQTKKRKHCGCDLDDLGGSVVSLVLAISGSSGSFVWRYVPDP